jgi:hypothetical protein
MYAVILFSLLLTSVLTGCFPVSAAQTLIPHEDPGATRSTIDAYSFLSEYATIFSLMSNQLYENASRLSEQLSHITLPADLSYILNRYNNLTQQLIDVLNDLQSTLDKISSLLDQNRLSDAEQSLNQAGVLVAKAQILLGDLKDATATVSQRLGVFSSAAQSRTQQAYNQLQSMLEKLNQLIERYHELLKRANQRIEEIKAENLKPATLTLSLNSTRCYVGSTISASGTLSSQGEPIGNRKVKLYIDGTETAEISTDINGNYQTAIDVPYKYVNSIAIQAIYSPAGSDKNEYLAALSPTVTLKLLFLITNLEISVPDVGHPGLPFTVTGKVTDTDAHGLLNRQVTVAFDGTIETQVKTNQEGAFTAKFTVNTQTSLGKHTLTVLVDAQNLYAPTSKQNTITIQKMATQLQVDAPTFIVLPAQLEVTGKATSSSAPLKGATIQIEYANISSTTETRDDGSFNISIQVPLNTVLAGNQELKVKAQPSEPWQATAETAKNIFALNSVSTSVALASSASLFAVAYMRLTKNRKTEKTTLQSKQTISTTHSVDSENKPVTAPQTIDTTRINGPRGQIIQFYTEALTAVQAATNIQLPPSMTLREYVQATQLKIGALAKEFRELTGLAEKSLYSPHEPHPSEINRAEELSKAIRGNHDAGT